jgi:hypothetical protein
VVDAETGAEVASMVTKFAAKHACSQALLDGVSERTGVLAAQSNQEALSGI